MSDCLIWIEKNSVKGSSPRESCSGVLLESLWDSPGVWPAVWTEWCHTEGQQASQGREREHLPHLDTPVLTTDWGPNTPAWPYQEQRGRGPTAGSHPAIMRSSESAVRTMTAFYLEKKSTWNGMRPRRGGIQNKLWVNFCWDPRELFIY